MISDARGGHVSPGIYTEEKEVTYSVKSLGITNLGLAGETQKGPAFQAIPIETWSDFTDYFGGTSAEKFKGTMTPKYELPYIAKEYLQESKNLQVVRVLGLSGYDAKQAFVIGLKVSGATTYPLGILRPKCEYGTLSASKCETTAKGEQLVSLVESVSISEYTGNTYGPECSIVGSAETMPLGGVVSAESDSTKIIVSGNTQVTTKFALKVVYYASAADAKAKENPITSLYNVSLNPFDKDYIYNVFPENPLNGGNTPLYIEAVYDASFNKIIQDCEIGTEVEFICGTTDKDSDFIEPFRCAVTPWIVSEVQAASQDVISMKKLFKFYTISDGNAANYQVKISIQNIKPDANDGCVFDVVVRDFYDTDATPTILEKYSKCNMQEGSSNFIGLKIGTYDGTYEAKSKYITVRVSDEEGIDSCVPAGFLGYPIPKYGMDKSVDVDYANYINTSVKTKRQYFGLTSDVLDKDMLDYKGASAYSNATGDFEPELLSNGFHLDSILSDEVRNAEGSVLGNATIMVDGVSGFTFSTVKAIQENTYDAIPRILTEDYMEDTLYADIATRKFTVYPYGGFDGWDIFRTKRTNGDFYKVTKYPYVEGCPFKTGVDVESLNATLNLHLPAKMITSDYYAYLAGYMQFANPQDIDINIFATPGIDWMNNTMLVEDALDVVEDVEDGRGGDAIYIITTPQYSDNNEVLDADDVVDGLDASEINSSYACTYFPWVKYYDTDSKIYIDLPVTKDVVRNMAHTDNVSYPWFAPAGINRGTVNCSRAIYKTTLADEDTLYEGLINPVKTFAVDGVKIWGNKTIYDTESPLNRVNVRRLMLRVKKLVVSASKELIFEQYDDTLEKQFKSLINPILANVKSNRGIYDYRLVVESTEETRDQHILPAKILIKPTPALEYISISFVVYPESVEFED